LIAELLEMLDRIEADDETRVVVLTGSPPAFCAGFDITRIESPGASSAGSERDLVERLCSRVREIEVPVIARVGGVASGAGCDLALSCDLRVASDEARLGMTPARLGLVYSQEGTARLVGTVGPAAAKELLFTGDLLDAPRALQLGMVNRLVPADELDSETDRLAATIAANAPLSVSASKLMVNLIADERPLSPDARAAVEEASVRVWMSADSQEGPQAFRERRPARFVGR
jgi:enoyl-CoA hydratase/carnithine racemase